MIMAHCRYIQEPWQINICHGGWGRRVVACKASSLGQPIRPLSSLTIKLTGLDVQTALWMLLYLQVLWLTRWFTVCVAHILSPSVCRLCMHHIANSYWRALCGKHTGVQSNIPGFPLFWCSLHCCHPTRSFYSYAEFTGFSTSPLPSTLDTIHHWQLNMSMSHIFLWK